MVCETVDENPSTIGKRQRKKKKNSRFISNAKGFGRKGVYGRGTHIDSDDYNYFINILDSMRNGFEDDEERAMLANNVFAATRDREVHFASNQIVSKALETLVAYVDAETMETFQLAFARNLRPICSDPYASHVLQKMVEIAFLRFVGKNVSAKSEQLEMDKIDSSVNKKPKLVSVATEEEYNLNVELAEIHRENCGQFLLKVSKFLLNNLEDFVWDRCANHLMRTCILSLAGIHVPKVVFEKAGTDMIKNCKEYPVPDEWKELIKEFAERLQMWPQFPEFPYQQYSSTLMSAICIALKNVDKKLLKHLGKKLLISAFLRSGDDDDPDDFPKIDNNNDEYVNSYDNPNFVQMGIRMEAFHISTDKVMKPCGISKLHTTGVHLPKVFKDQISLCLLETLLSVASPKLIAHLYDYLFNRRIKTLALDSLTNFSVQKLLNHIQEKEHLECIFEELYDYIEMLLKIGHAGVVTALTSACLRLQVRQNQMVKALRKAMHLDANESKKNLLFICLVKMIPCDFLNLEKGEEEKKLALVNLQGSLIVQNVLKFNKPIYMVNCIVETPAHELVSIFNTPNGSYICDAFVQSKFIGEKSRERLIRNLIGFYVDLAITRNGSRVIELLFEAAADNFREKIVKELADKINMVKSTSFGQLICSKFRVEMYRLSPNQWRNTLKRKQPQAKQLLEDFIN